MFACLENTEMCGTCCKITLEIAELLSFRFCDCWRLQFCLKLNIEGDIPEICPELLEHLFLGLVLMISLEWLFLE